GVADLLLRRPSVETVDLFEKTPRGRRERGLPELQRLFGGGGRIGRAARRRYPMRRGRDDVAILDDVTAVPKGFPGGVERAATRLQAREHGSLAPAQSEASAQDGEQLLRTGRQSAVSALGLR